MANEHKSSGNAVGGKHQGHQPRQPRDAQVMSAILLDQGVADFEPRVVGQLMEYAYSYVTDVLEEAKVCDGSGC